MTGTSPHVITSVHAIHSRKFKARNTVFCLSTLSLLRSLKCIARGTSGKPQGIRYKYLSSHVILAYFVEYVLLNLCIRHVYMIVPAAIPIILYYHFSFQRHLLLAHPFSLLISLLLFRYFITILPFSVLAIPYKHGRLQNSRQCREDCYRENAATRRLHIDVSYNDRLNHE